jgi:DNA-binding NarL/FixJ family response regulator
MVRILVVDDQPVVRKMILAILQRQADWIVCGQAADGREAVERSRTLSPQIILLDLEMPVMNGFDAAKQIAGSRPDVLILMISFHDDPLIARRSKDCGAKGFLSKQQIGQHLIPAIQTLLRGDLHFPSGAIH